MGECSYAAARRCGASSEVLALGEVIFVLVKITPPSSKSVGSCSFQVDVVAA
jgi:hypothetical protein